MMMSNFKPARIPEFPLYILLLWLKESLKIRCVNPAVSLLECPTVTLQHFKYRPGQYFNTPTVAEDVL